MAVAPHELVNPFGQATLDGKRAERELLGPVIVSSVRRRSKNTMFALTPPA